jgi:hypothetical protein
MAPLVEAPALSDVSPPHFPVHRRPSDLSSGQGRLIRAAFLLCPGHVFKVRLQARRDGTVPRSINRFTTSSEIRTARPTRTISIFRCQTQNRSVATFNPSRSAACGKVSKRILLFLSMPRYGGLLTDYC